MSSNNTRGFYYKKLLDLGLITKAEWKKSKKNELREKYEKYIYDNSQPVFNVELVNRARPEIKYVVFQVDEQYTLYGVNDDNIDSLMGYIRTTFMNLYNQVILNFGNRTKFNITIKNSSYYFKMSFTDNIEVLLQNLEDDIIRKMEEYDEFGVSNFFIDSFMIEYVTNTEMIIRGFNDKKIKNNDKFLLIESNTKLNCFYVAIYTSLNWKNNKDLLTDSNKRNKNGERFKVRNNFNINEFVYEHIKFVAMKLFITINVYNNEFELIDSYKFGEEIAHIMISDNHARCLINKMELLQTYDNFDFKDVETDDKKEKEGTITKIRKSKLCKSYNNKIVAWDVETYLKPKNNPEQERGKDFDYKVYCSGYAYIKPNTNLEYIEINNKKSLKPKCVEYKYFYSNDDNLKSFIDDIKKNIDLFEEYTFYAHNGGKFDLYLLLHDVLLMDSEITILDKGFIELNNSIISLDILYKDKKIYFRDSYKLFQSPLASLTKDFNIVNVKGDIQHNLINENTYEIMKDEILKYFRNDCVGLLECLSIFSKTVYELVSINITRAYTGASLSKLIYFSSYYDGDAFKGIYKLDIKTDKFIRRSYSGGRNECFKIGTAKNLYYYDATSLYPFCGIKSLPIGKPIYDDYTNKITISMKEYIMKYTKEYIGFMKCLVRGNKDMLNNNLPFHQIRDKKLLFPYIENWTKITIPLTDIQYGLKLGYEYKPLKCIRFRRGQPLKEFFKNGFEQKAQAKRNNKPSLEYFWKIVINSGYGFWCFNPYNKNSVKISKTKIDNWQGDFIKNRLISYSNVGDYSITRIINDSLPTKSNIGIGSIISSNARLYLHQFMNDIKKLGFNIYYTDTDSVITDCNISHYPEILKKYRKDGEGNILGSFKNELSGVKDLNGNKYNWKDENGFDLPFDDFILTGLKSYAFSYNGEPVIAKLKGYKKRDFDGNIIGLKEQYNNIEKMNNGEEINQKAFQILGNKNDMMELDNPFGLRYAEITKKFKKLYTKGIVDENGNITPLTI